MNLTSALVTALLLCGAGESDSPADELRLESVLVTLIEQVAIPAQEAGVLAQIAVREGQAVHEGDLLAQIDATDAHLVGNRARIELDVARKAAKNDVDVRLAKKQLQLAKNDLGRAKESIERFKKSVSGADLDKLQLETEKGVLTIEHAEQQFDLAQLAEQLKQNEVAVAARGIERRRIASPLDGVVVELKHRRGEWVEPGETVVRVVRMDRLRVEGFVSAQMATRDLIQRPVSLHVDLGSGDDRPFPGEIVFVNPEIDPVNGQVRIWAEVENRDERLRPGLAGSMIIHPLAATDASDITAPDDASPTAAP